MKPIHACPICEKAIEKGEDVSWEFELNGTPTTFSVQCCLMDAYLCKLFPSLKKTLARSETVAMMLRQLANGY